MKNLKKYFVLLAVSLAVCLPSLSEEYYYITEEQMQTLELRYQEQEQQLQTLQTQLDDARNNLILCSQQLTNCENQLAEAETSLNKSNNKNLMQIIFASISGLVIGAAAASVTIAILN